MIDASGDAGAQRIKLYEYQARGLDAGRAEYRAGRRAVLFVLPTGGGKTTMAGAAAVGRIARGGKVAAFAHRRELVDQMAKRLQAMGLEVGAFGLGASAPVQVVSTQAALSRRELPDADLVILDEAHHYVSPEYIQIPRTYLRRGAHLMGLSATPERADGKGLGGEGGIFDGLVVVAQVAELVEINAQDDTKGITPIEIIEPKGHVRKLAQDPVDAYLQWTRDRSCVVFSPNVKSAETFAAQFEAKGVEAAVVHGELEDDLRDGALARFARGDLRVLVNVNVLTEGWDAPICDVAMLARPMGSIAQFIQCVGRARRARAGKALATLVDLSGNVAMHGHPDQPLVFSLDDRGCSRVDSSVTLGFRFCRSCRRELSEDLKRDPELARCPECGCEISKIYVPTAEDVELARLRRDEQRRRVPQDKKTKALVTMYAEGIRAGHKRSSAERKFRGLFKHEAPSSMRAIAWRAALEKVAEAKGDAWLPPEEEQHGTMA